MVSPFSRKIFCSRFLPLQNVLIVEVDSLGAANDDDLFLVGEIAKAAGVGQRIEDPRSAPPAGYSPGRFTFAGDVELLAVDLRDRHGDVRAVDVIRKRLLQLVAQALRRQPRRLHVADQRNGDLAVRPHHIGAREILFAPHLDEQDVLRADHVNVGVDARRAVSAPAPGIGLGASVFTGPGGGG